MITLDLYEFKNLIMDMSEIGAAKYAKTLSSNSDLISQRKAFKSFGIANVKRWEKKSLIEVKRSGKSENSKKLYSYSELLTISKTEFLIKNTEKPCSGKHP